MCSRPPISRRLFSLTAAAFLTSLAIAAPDRLDAQTTGPSLVILVRHAEKAAEPSGDPPLTPAGRARADSLLDALAHMPPTAILVSATKRTAETAATVAGKFGVKPQVISLAGGGAAHVTATVDAIRKLDGVVLVVGHSNTVPAIIKALGGPAMPDLCDSSYSNLFVLQPGIAGKPAQLIMAHYGAGDAPLSPNCPTMTTK